MEVVEICPKKRVCTPTVFRSPDCPCNVKCTKRYVQPAKVESFAPEKVYCPPTKPIDSNTTYHLSYLDMDQATARHARAQLYRPTPALDMTGGKISDQTTNRLSYQANWGVVKAKAVVPCRRALTGQGPMQCITTARHDYVPKYMPRPDLIIPCQSIRTSLGPLDGRTTAGLSYMDPGPVEPVVSFKPTARYCPPASGIAKDTTQKLSYQPFRVGKKEIYPWAQKPMYRPPQAVMEGATTYSKSYLENERPARDKPFIPGASCNVLPCGAGFAGKTIYRESYLPCDVDRVVPFVPCGSIALSDQKMSGDTTNKLSYQPVCAERRSAIIPCRRNMMGDGPMQCITTNRHDFVPKMVPRPDLVIPCDNIRGSDQPLEDRTTAALSYMDPGPMEAVQSFKPSSQYCRPTAKIDGETINKLSYQPWTPGPKEVLPWARKNQYEPPKDRFVGDTIYHMSFPAPGYYVEDCVPAECPCPPDHQGDCGPNPPETYP